jgi:O-succinylbenzoic acid--CoA ligase
VARLGPTVPDWLRQRAHITPRRRALSAGDAHWSFAELDRHVDNAAAALLARGIRAHDRAGVLAANSAGYVLAVHALMRVGAVVVPLNTRLAPQEVDWQVRDAELSHVLDDAELGHLVDLDAGTPSSSRDFDLAEPHSIMYTSGTTGRPKGAVLTYGNHWWSATSSALNLGLQPGDAWLACLPLFHVGGLSILLKSVIYGMTAVVHPRFDAARANAAIDQQGVSMVSVVSTMLDRMLAERGERPFPATLRCVLLGGGPAPLALLERALRAQAPVVQTYGLTETASQIVTLAPEDALRKVGSAGKPLMGAQLRIESDAEICVRGPTVSPGYLHQPLRDDDWLHTGDLGYLDDEGYLYVLDRRDDLIVSGGENVYPAEVEAALLAHPAVGDAGVVGEPDPQWGRSVRAVVVLRSGMNASECDLIAFCRERLAGYKVPRRIVFRDGLPRNAAGKLVRRELRTER